MAVTINDIAKALGQMAPEAGSPEAEQWQMWISDAQLLIEARLGDLALLNQSRLDYVVREAVAAHIRRPDDATSIEVAVDDGRESRRYSSASGRVRILDEWWKLLAPETGTRKAFSIDTAPRRWGIHADVCSLVFGATYCSCGADLTGGWPLYEVGY